MRRELTAEELSALRAYAAKHGRLWKSALREDWYHARLWGPLHALRNDPNFGPRWLVEFRLPDA